MVMSQQRAKKLKPLLEDLPQGFLADAAWLTAREIDRKSILDYERRGWLERVARSLYRRPSESHAPPDWKTVILSMQRVMGYDVHVGGRTALDLQGFEHYLRLGGEPLVHLYGEPPAWLKRLPDAGRYRTHTRVLFGDNPVGVQDLSVASGEARSLGAPWDWPMIVSAPERAILELLDEVPAEETFHMADVLFEGLTSARPRLLDKTLKACRSKKVKRLFFVFADRHAHAWRKYVDPKDYDLGSGPRALTDGGRLHPLYEITVPPDYLPAQKDERDGS